MSGELGETNFYHLRETHDPDQLQLSDYCSTTGETTVAVVREPNDTGITEVCDEWMQELGMPRDVLEDFWEVRGEYRRNDAIRGASNRAYGVCRLDERYEEYIRDSAEAQARVDEIVERLESGEDITLVCFEGEGQACHRYRLIDMINSRLESNFDITQ